MLSAVCKPEGFQLHVLLMTSLLACRILAIRGVKLSIIAPIVYQLTSPAATVS